MIQGTSPESYFSFLLALLLAILAIVAFCETKITSKNLRHFLNFGRRKIVKISELLPAFICFAITLILSAVIPVYSEVQAHSYTLEVVGCVDSSYATEAIEIVCSNLEKKKPKLLRQEHLHVAQVTAFLIVAIIFSLLAIFLAKKIGIVRREYSFVTTLSAIGSFLLFGVAFVQDALIKLFSQWVG